MALKLLSPVALKEAHSQQIVRDILRAKETADVVNKNNQRLAQSEADFNLAVARRNTQWATEEEEHQKRLVEMENEIKPLEERKKQANIPVEIEKQKADTLLKEAHELLKQVKEKEKKADETQEILEDRLDEVSDRETDVSTREQALERRKKGIELQEEMTQIGVEKLSKQITDFQVYKQKQEASLYERKKEVSLAEINFKAKTEKYARDLEALRLYEIKLNDQRGTLERAFARLKK